MSLAATTDAGLAARAAALRADARRIARLAWPVFIGQLSVLAFSTIDTLLIARHSALDLAALAVGAAAYVTIFIGFMGVLLAISPIVGQLHGAGRDEEAGHHVHQAVWIALGLAAIGSALLIFPTPFLSLAKVSPEVAARVRGYLLALAFSLPASLLFTVFRGFNTAVSRPKAVMSLQLAGLALKLPLSTALAWGLPSIGLPALGVVGCGVATCVAMWAQVLMAYRVLRRDPVYARYRIIGRPLDAPDRQALKAHLKLGIPMGLSILIEVTGFSFMAIFVARLGVTAVAGHQIAANLAALLYMMPLGIANATTTLVAQRVGASDLHDARRLGWHGMLLGTLMATIMGTGVLLARGPIVGLYTADAAIAAAALPLVSWLAAFHIADAAQTVASFVLRAYRIAKVPLVIYALALWVVGLGGGYLLAFDIGGFTPGALRGARGFWAAGTAGLVLAAVALSVYLAWVIARMTPKPPGPAGATAG